MFNSLEKFKKNIAFEDDKGKSLSYLDILSFADHFNKLIPPRSLVFCLCSNNEESVIGYVSFIKNKIVHNYSHIEKIGTFSNANFFFGKFICADFKEICVNTIKKNYVIDETFNYKVYKSDTWLK